MNALYKINNVELYAVMQEIKNDSTVFLAELQGESIQSWSDYSVEIEKVLHFPSSCQDSIDRYLDWIRDLSWFDDLFFHPRFVLIIYNFSLMLENDISLKRNIEEDFIKIILPWWDGEVEKFVVGGRRKQFDVYLVD